MTFIRKPAFRKLGLVHGYMHVTGKPPLDDLAASCRSLGMGVRYPDLPDRTGQPRLSAWLEALNRTMPGIDGATAIASISLGCVTTLHQVAQERVKAVGLLVLIAPVTPSVVADAYPFLAHFFDGLGDAIQRVARKARQIEVLTSDNDPWAVPAYTAHMAQRLRASLHIIHNGGHLDIDTILPDGTRLTRFPLVLDMIAPVVGE